MPGECSCRKRARAQDRHVAGRQALGTVQVEGGGRRIARRLERGERKQDRQARRTVGAQSESPIELLHGPAPSPEGLIDSAERDVHPRLEGVQAHRLPRLTQRDSGTAQGQMHLGERGPRVGKRGVDDQDAT